MMRRAAVLALFCVSYYATEAEAVVVPRQTAPATYQAYNLSVPISHFPDSPRYAPHVEGTFPLRYWVDDRYYKPGGPVFVLEAGEADGEERLVYLQTGIVNILTKATNGLG
jgi:hypothetical protein